MVSNSEKLALKLAEFKKRIETKDHTEKVEAVLSAQSGAMFKGFVSGVVREEVNRFWIVFASRGYLPFSTLSLEASEAEFKEWVTFCYKAAGLPDTVLISIGDLEQSAIAEVEIYSVEEWISNLNNYLTDRSMNFDVLLTSPLADIALELWEEEHHYSAFLAKRNETEQSKGMNSTR